MVPFQNDDVMKTTVCADAFMGAAAQLMAFMLLSKTLPRPFKIAAPFAYVTVSLNTAVRSPSSGPDRTFFPSL